MKEKSNYAFKRTAEQALRSKQTVVPQPLNAALDVKAVEPDRDSNTDGCGKGF
jgi:hypothetical protein